MKTVKSMLIATALIGTSLVSGLPAQEVASPAYKPAVGDTVRMNPDCERYLTGEKPSTWVYNTTHTIGQVGTQRFPEGILLMPIKSWTCLDCITPLNAHRFVKPPFRLSVGDSVRINPDCERYLTGERPSSWVYGTTHTIGQIGTQRFPDGVLLMSIRSWMCWDCITLVKAQEEPIDIQVPLAEQPAQAEEGTTPVEEHPVQAEEETSPVEETPVQAEEHPAQVTEKPGRVVEGTVSEQGVETTPSVAQTEEQEPEEEVAHPSAKGDSIRIRRNFYGKYDRFTLGLRGGIASMMHHTVKGH
ncbi:MAG: hypothetical protein K5660_09145 [Paludibacteraceae bacterium]|nr:hypothetical protein [Paludibacteraceae bacterium]